VTSEREELEENVKEELMNFDKNKFDLKLIINDLFRIQMQFANFQYQSSN